MKKILSILAICSTMSLAGNLSTLNLGALASIDKGQRGIGAEVGFLKFDKQIIGFRVGFINYMEQELELKINKDYTSRGTTRTSAQTYDVAYNAFRVHALIPLSINAKGSPYYITGLFGASLLMEYIFVDEYTTREDYDVYELLGIESQEGIYGIFGIEAGIKRGIAIKCMISQGHIIAGFTIGIGL
tara:strand:+ start:222 stop:782 length:561 start_codon:yes stop_codon:yes gene_type:complete